MPLFGRHAPYLYNLASVSRPQIHFLFGRFVPQCAHDVDKVFADYSVLQYTHGGGVSLNVGERSFTLEGRWFFSSYPGPRIAFKPSAPHKTWVHRYLAFKGPQVAAWEREGLFPVPPMPAPPREDYSARFDALLDLSRRDDPWGKRRAVVELERLLCELAEHRASPAADPQWLATAKSRLETLGRAEPDYDALATELGLTPRTFRREFAKRTGLPPHRYLLAARVSHAREMLAQTDLPIKQIARELGYSDVFYFTRQFRSLAGVPPAVFRKTREG